MGFDFKATRSPDPKITERQEKRNIFNKNTVSQYLQNLQVAEIVISS